MTARAIVRTGGAADLDQIMPVMNAAFDPLFGERWTIAQLAGALVLPGTDLMVAEVGSRIAGFALVRHVADEAEILLIATHPQFQRQRVGTALLETVFNKLKQDDVAFIHIEMRVDNPALAFYHQFEFAIIGHRRDYYRGLDGRLRDAMTLRRYLA
jgi:ribosomal-protein-alanine N-acetyltransferase